VSVTVDEKIENFRKTIFEDIERNSSLKKESLMKDIENKKQLLGEEIELKRTAMLDEATKKSEKEKQQLLAKAYSEEHHKILVKQQEYIEKVVELLKNKAAEYTQSAEYRDNYLSSRIEYACKGFEDVDSVVFYFTQKDIQMFGDSIYSIISSHRKGKAFELKEESDTILGGFIISDKDLMMKADYTLVTLINESRDTIGISISQMFDEVIN
jgi:V/A-type H+-transporting ATPase subunit E